MSNNILNLVSKEPYDDNRNNNNIESANDNNDNDITGGNIDNEHNDPHNIGGYSLQPNRGIRRFRLEYGMSNPPNSKMYHGHQSEFAYSAVWF